VNFDHVLRLQDFEPFARDAMDPSAFDYFTGGAADEVTLRDNVAAFARRKLRPRVLVDVSGIDTRTTMLETPVAMPVALAPTAMDRLAHPDGEVAVSRAAARAGVLMHAATFSSCSLEEIATAAGGPRWFQLYVHQDRGLAEELVTRAAAAGYRAVVVTADLPVPGYRERELRSRFVVPDDARPGNYRDRAGVEEVLGYLTHNIDQSLTWSDIEWVRGLSELPVVVKGVLTAEDARLAVEHGAAGVVVSNHGGRQLDRAPASIDVLQEVVDELRGDIEVYLDGGVRRGSDVLIALALGARAVLLGRPYLWALAAGGEEGVARALELIRAELENSMALLGVTRPDQVNRAHVM
jgi:isopentenyl diphosphate isomerase/L-lactate dehydrogenase-like FMN-dependent dehydrogenase